MTRPATSASTRGLRAGQLPGDFERDLGAIPAGGPRMTAFPGFTVGNLEPLARGAPTVHARTPTTSPAAQSRAVSVLAMHPHGGGLG